MPASYTSLTTVQDCERKFAYKYVHRLRALDRESPALVLGSWWHAARAADSIRRGVEADSLVAACDVIETSDDGPTLAVAFDYSTLRVHDLPATSDLAKADVPMTAEAVLDVAEEWWSTMAPADVEEYVEYHGVPLPQHLRNLWARYVDHYGERLAKQHPLLVEAEWSRDLGDFEIGGRIDEVYLDTVRGIVVVCDWKSHGSWPSESEMVLDLMDAQIHLYAWGASTLLADTEHSVAAVEYDRVRTKFPATPSLTKSGNLSKSTTDYDLWTYLRWIESGEATYERYKKNIPAEEIEAAERAHELGRMQAADNEGVPEDELDFPDFDWKDIAEVTVTEPDPDVVEALDPADPENAEQFFRRGAKPVNRHVIISHLKSLKHSEARGQDVRERVKDGEEIPRSMGRKCQWCDFLKICNAEMFGEIDATADPAAFGLRTLPTA